jgi:hypothetical protein
MARHALGAGRRFEAREFTDVAYVNMPPKRGSGPRKAVGP